MRVERQSELLALSQPPLGDDLLGVGGDWDIVNIFGSKTVVLKLHPSAHSLVAASTVEVWAEHLLALMGSAGESNRGQVLSSIASPMTSIMSGFTTNEAVAAALVAMVPANVWGLPLSKSVSRIEALPGVAEERTYPRLPPHHKFNTSDEKAVVVMLEEWIHERWARVKFLANVPRWVQYPIELAKLVQRFLLTNGSQSDRYYGVFSHNPATHVLAELGELRGQQRVFTFVGEDWSVKHPAAGVVSNGCRFAGGGATPVLVGDKFCCGGFKHEWRTARGRLCRMYGLGLMQALEIIPAAHNKYMSCTVNLALCDPECVYWDGPAVPVVVPRKPHDHTEWWDLKTVRTEGIRKVHGAWAAFVNRVNEHQTASFREKQLWTTAGSGVDDDPNPNGSDSDDASGSELSDEATDGDASDGDASGNQPSGDDTDIDASDDDASGSEPSDANVFDNAVWAHV